MERHAQVIGIMQGRLSPPVEGKLQAFPPDWQAEIPLAKALGFSFLEWVHEDAHPLNAPSKIAAIRETGFVLCLSADYFLEHPLITRSGTLHEPTLDHLWWLLNRAEQLKLHHIVLPFLGKARLITDAQRMGLADLCKRLNIRLHQFFVEVHLETDLHPDWIMPLYRKYPRIRDCYDTGNRAAQGLGAEDLEELLPYIGSVHLKDCLVKGTSVAPGHGSVRWAKVFPLLKPLLIPMTLQFQRGATGFEQQTCDAHRRFVVDGFAV